MGGKSDGRRKTFSSDRIIETIRSVLGDSSGAGSGKEAGHVEILKLINFEASNRKNSYTDRCKFRVHLMAHLICGSRAILRRRKQVMAEVTAAVLENRAKEPPLRYPFFL